MESFGVRHGLTRGVLLTRIVNIRRQKNKQAKMRKELTNLILLTLNCRLSIIILEELIKLFLPSCTRFLGIYKFLSISGAVFFELLLLLTKHYLHTQCLGNLVSCNPRLPSEA